MSRRTKRLVVWVAITGVVAAACVWLVFAVRRVRDSADHMADT
jgi:hypothetical protein